MFSFLALKVDDGYGGFCYELTTWGYVSIIVAILILLAAIAFVRSRTTADKTKETKIISTKQLVFCSMLLALAVVTSLIKLPVKMPMGGSATLCSMLFICYIGYLYGLRIGLLSAVAYGALQLIIEPYIIGIPQLLMDYIVAFGALGLSGIFKNSKHGLIKGYLLGTFGRFVASTISGLIFFAQYAASYNVAPIIYSVAYNGSYIYTEVILTLIIICMPPVSNALKSLKRSSQ